MQSKQMLPQTTTMQQLWKYSDTLCSSFNTLLGSDGQTDTTTTDQSASPAYSSPGNISTWSQKIENITEGYFPLSVSFVVCTSEKEYMWIYITVKLARPLYSILQERSVTQTRCSTLRMRNFPGEAKCVFLPKTRGKTWFEVTLIESDLGGFDQRDETWLVIKYITTFTGGNREVLSFLEEVLRALHCHFCQGF